jgi:signal transduction histidine kinase
MRPRLRGLVPRAWLRLPRRTVRLRLAALYAALFLVSGAGLLTITYELVAHELPSNKSQVSFGRSGSLQAQAPVAGAGGSVVIAGPGAAQAGAQSCAGIGDRTSASLPSPDQVYQCVGYLRSSVTAQHDRDLGNLLIGSCVALCVMTIAALGFGWLMAGRVLRPLRTITSTARNISACNLHERLALAGPDDELKELGDTFDGLLGRLEAAFDAQRRFVANASHELRTPLARQRTLVEVALAEPEPTVAALRDVCERVLVAGDQQERLIEALLTLARSQRGLDQWEPIDLAALTADVLQARQAEAGAKNLQVSCTVASGAMGPAGAAAVLLGDAPLAERLVANLVDNAIRHNLPGGWISLRVAAAVGQAVLTVANSGPVVPPGEVSRLFAPFQRLSAARGVSSGQRDGQGLGLSIVSAIAAAHGADLEALARPDGGLHIELRFPRLLAGPPPLPAGPLPVPAAQLRASAMIT